MRKVLRSSAGSRGMTRVLVVILAAGMLALWTLPADAKSGGISTAKNRYDQIHEQKTADRHKPRDAKADVGTVLSQAETKKP
jgi:predicted negative regulator of RcsB-dependent stress response